MIADVLVPTWDWVHRDPTRLFVARVAAVGVGLAAARRALRYAGPPAAALYALAQGVVYAGERLRRPGETVPSVFGSHDNSQVGEALGVIARRLGL